MKALVYDTYGQPEVLRIEEIEIPVPQNHEVLIKVHAASVNSWDWDLLRGEPILTRLGAMRKPRYRTLGADVAGVIAAVGAGVTRFQVGDEVFGDLCASGWGGFAEYVCAHENFLTLKPKGLSFEQAAATSQAAVLALQGLRDVGKLRAGHELLINGAGGGVGTFGIQYARYIGAEVTAVDSGEKLKMLGEVGADHVVDYREHNYTAMGKRYDLILDVVGNRSVHEVKRALKPGGAYVIVGASLPRILLALLAAPLLSSLAKKRAAILVHRPNHEDQAVWAALMEEGHVVPVIDRQFPLSEAAQAIRYLGEGRAQGKVVVTMER